MMRHDINFVAAVLLVIVPSFVIALWLEDQHQFASNQQQSSPGFLFADRLQSDQGPFYFLAGEGHVSNQRKKCRQGEQFYTR